MIWLLWLAAIAASFAWLETRAIRRGTPTLSLATWRLFLAYPLEGVIIGMFVGGLMVHFFWHWCPPGSVSMG